LPASIPGFNLSVAGVLALAKGAVAILAQLLEAPVQGPNMPLVDPVGLRLKVVGAQGRQAMSRARGQRPATALEGYSGQQV